jgi:16S rRNA (guanine527-N7)-methyltransferase
MPRDRESSASIGHELGELLEKGAEALSLPIDPSTRQRLLGYVTLISKWNAVYNLTAIRDLRQMLVQHLLDSLSIVQPLRRRIDLDRARIADVGSGAGLPGLVLAMLAPGLHLTSIEPVGKKAAFQRQVQAEFALTNVEIITGRAEAVHAPQDLVVCRAFASLNDFVAVTAGLCRPDTLIAAMKGTRAGALEEAEALPPGFAVELEPLTVPYLDAERTLVLIRRAGGPA